MIADPKHQASLEQLIKLPDQEIRKRITIENHKDADFVDAEVIVTLVRMRFGQKSGLLDAAAAALTKRMNRLAGKYFKMYPQWETVVNASSETLAETTMSAWEALLADEEDVSFAEVRFLPWMERRILDYLKSQITLKNSMPSYDAMTVEDEEGNETGLENLLAADEEDTPEAEFDRKKLSDDLFALMMTWEEGVRQAVYFRLEFEYDWKLVAELLQTSIPTARKYYKIGIERLNGAIYE